MKDGMKTALIIEDDLNNRKLEKDLLQGAGYIVHEAEDAEAGLKKAKKESPDIIILDYQLPGMSGLQALEKIIADRLHPSFDCLIHLQYSEKAQNTILSMTDSTQV